MAASTARRRKLSSCSSLSASRGMGLFYDVYFTLSIVPARPPVPVAAGPTFRHNLRSTGRKDSASGGRTRGGAGTDAQGGSRESPWPVRRAQLLHRRVAGADSMGVRPAKGVLKEQRVSDEVRD